MGCMMDMFRDRVFYIRDMPPEVVAALSRELRASLYAPNEVVPMERALFAVRRGSGWRALRVLIVGDVWGEDAILSRQHLRDLVPVRSLCYFEVLSLQVAALRTALVDHPTEAARVRWAAVQLAFCRAVKKVAAVAGDRIGMSDLPMELRLSLITDILTNAPLSGRRRAVRNASFMSTGSAPRGQSDEVVRTADGADGADVMSQVKASLAEIVQDIRGMKLALAALQR